MATKKVVTRRMWNAIKNKKVELDEEIDFAVDSFPGCCGATILHNLTGELFPKPRKKDYNKQTTWFYEDRYEDVVRHYDLALNVETCMGRAWDSAKLDCDFLGRTGRGLPDRGAEFGGTIVLMDAGGIETGREPGDAGDIGIRHLAAWLKYERGYHVVESPPSFNPNTGAPCVLWTVTHNDKTDTER